MPENVAVLDIAVFDPDYDALLADIYQGPLEDPPWRSFLPRFCHETRALAVSLVLRPPAEDDEGLILNYQRQDNEDAPARELADPSDWPSSAYKERFFALDPFVNLPSNRVVGLDEILSEEALLNSEYYRHYLEPAGVFHILGADTVEGDGLVARLRACRGRREPPFGPRERTLFARVVPHLRRAITVHARLNRIESERDLYAGAVDRLSVATLVLDEEGELISHNGVAAELLEEQDGLALAGGRLTFALRERGEEFRNLFAEVLSQTGADRPALAAAMRISRPSGRPDLGLVIKPVPCSEWSEGPRRLAVFISDPQRKVATSRQIIRQLFDFTNAEAALALLLAQGRSVAEAAEELSVSPHTARAQLKSIFSKTGVGRQAELVRLIVKSVANLG